MCDDHSGVLIHIPGASMVRSDGTPRPNGRMRGIDACIAPLVKVLNGAGIGTVASCCGHGDQPGNIALADGRELVIMADFDSARALDAWLAETGPDYEAAAKAYAEAWTEWWDDGRGLEHDPHEATLKSSKLPWMLLFRGCPTTPRRNEMSEKQWHVFYRTTGMQESKLPGFKRADFLADSAADAINSLVETRHNVLHARAYPGASAYTVSVDWTPEIEVRHEPHDPEDS